MQKAILVHAVLQDAHGHCWSIEVDGPKLGSGHEAKSEAPLRRLLEDGWRVVHTCPMPGELDSCCLVIVEKPSYPHPESAHDHGSVEAGVPAEWLSASQNHGRVETLHIDLSNPN